MALHPVNTTMLDEIMKDIQAKRNYIKMPYLIEYNKNIDWLKAMFQACGNDIPESLRIYQYKNNVLSLKWYYDIGHLSLEIDLATHHGYLYESIPGINQHDLVQKYDLNDHMEWKDMAEIINGRINYVKK